MGVCLHGQLYYQGKQAVIEEMIKTAKYLEWKRSDGRPFVNFRDLMVYIESEKMKKKTHADNQCKYF